MRALVVSAAESSAGKTTLVLGLLRALRDRGIAVRAAKSGPDYIDPQFHRAACGRESVNLDAWAMPDGLLRSLASGDPSGGTAELLLIEGAMGVLDGAGESGTGSTACLCELLGLPVLLVVNAARQSGSAVLGPLGLAAARPSLRLAGVVLNRAGSPRHEQILRAAFRSERISVLGAVPRRDELRLPDRHLGLVPAGEHERLESWLAEAAETVQRCVDIDTLLAKAAPLRDGSSSDLVASGIAPLGQRIAVASDEAFAFTYPHLAEDWRRAGAELRRFSPLNGEGPDPDADAVFLPGGYPELHAGAIAGASGFRKGMTAAANRGAVVYGECGGYMVLGRGLEDGEGARHEMLGLLNHSTSFKRPRLHLGYRVLRATKGAPFNGTYSGHEFHYSRLLEAADDCALFDVLDADGKRLPEAGAYKGAVSGSFAHLICARAD